MILLGLTGSIGMGKSSTAQLFRERGIPVHDADAAVHQAYGKGGEAVAPLAWAFPGVVTDEGEVDRKALREVVVGDPEAMAKLEAIIHPIVGEVRNDFLHKARVEGADIVVLDVPLLFETGGDSKVDAIVVATAPEALQRARVLARQGMTEEEFEAILARQTPDSEKRQRADFTVNTAYGFAYAGVQVDEILRAIRGSGDTGAETDETCGKSHSTPKPQGSSPATENESSKSDV